jgi:hypothetical protein
MRGSRLNFNKLFSCVHSRGFELPHPFGHMHLEQLRVLDGSLKDIAKSAFAGDAEALVSNGQFLQNKFSEKLAFRP